MKNYFIYVSLLTVALMAAYYFLKDHFPPSAVFIIPVFFVITVTSHLLLLRAMTREPGKFQMYFMAATALKVLGSFLFLTVMYLAGGGIDKGFVLAFMGTYIIYTFFEMIVLLPMTRRK